MEKLKCMESRSIDGARTALILFHGYGASMADLHGLSHYLDPDQTCDWFFPDGWLAAEGGGRAWFPVDAEALQIAMMTGVPRNLRDKHPPEFDQAVELGKSFIEEKCAHYDRVIIGGFSQGAMICSHIAPLLSDKIDGLWLFSGNLIAEQALTEKLQQSRPFHFFQSHGRQDPVLGFEHAEALYQALTNAGNTGEFMAFNGMHEITIDVLDKVKPFLSEA